MEINLDSYERGEKIIGISSVALIVGAFLPWWSGFGSQSGIGYEAGIFTLFVGCAGLFIVIRRDWSKVDKIGATALGIIAVFFIFAAFIDIGDAALANPGSGLYLSFLGALLMIFGPVVSTVYQFIFSS